MEGIVLIVVALVIAGMMGKAPSAIHDPGGYSDHRGCLGMLSFVVAIGILLAMIRGCTG